jgi:hypothetical protein
VAELSRQEMHRLARLGAQARLEEMRREESAIRRAFPELFKSATRPVAAASAGRVAGGVADGTEPKRRRRRTNMSPAMRKAVSERMKKYWATWRKNNKK